jgi:ABC-type branched-subunit amino acid transport system substrate-binding protein
VAGLAIVAMLAAACGSSGGSSGSGNGKLTASAPGITANTITVGGTDPLTGPAAPGYSEIAPAGNAYFQYVNAHGGVFGRKIIYKDLNDQYNPTITTTMTRQLVLNDNVFAVYNSLGTPTHLAVAPFLNQQGVPDVFVASGCDCWNAPSTLPKTFGWQLDYIREGKILGNYIKTTFPGKKIGFFFQNDEFGKDGVKGLLDVLPASSVVDQETYTPTVTNIGPNVAKLKAAGAQVVVSFSIPAFTALLKLNMLGLTYNPTLVVSNVGSDPITLGGLLTSFAKQTGKSVNGDQLTNGVITDAYLPSLGTVTTNSWVALFKKIHDQYIPNLPFDGNVLYGMSAAYTFVQAMFKAGKNPTRASLISAIENGLPQGTSVSPMGYSSTSHFGATGAFMGMIKNGVIVQTGPVMVTDATPSGAITAFTTAQPAVPASGIPGP